MRSWDEGVGLPPLPESEMAAGGKRKGESCPFSQSELLFAFWKSEGPALGSWLVGMPCYSEGSPGNKQPGYTSNWLFWKRPDEGSVGGAGEWRRLTCPVDSGPGQVTLPRFSHL